MIKKLWKNFLHKLLFGFTDNDKMIEPISCDSLDKEYLFDFKNYSSQYSSNGTPGSWTVSTGVIGNQTVNMSELSLSESKIEEKRLIVQLSPKQVLNELETVPTPFSLSNIDDKIFILKDKLDLIRQSYSKRELNALIERLENRKKYSIYRKFFDQFQNTTDEKIDILLKKHSHLTMKTSDIFVPEFPDAAVKIMKDYVTRMMLVCKKKPVFYVIAKQDDFKKAYEKRDPILLVQSPFGFYWQILGAWEEEMLLLGEL